MPLKRRAQNWQYFCKFIHFLRYLAKDRENYGLHTYLVAKCVMVQIDPSPRRLETKRAREKRLNTNALLAM